MHPCHAATDHDLLPLAPGAPPAKKQKLAEHAEDVQVLHENAFLADLTQHISKLQRTVGVDTHSIPDEVDEALGKLREVEAWTAKKAAASQSGGVFGNSEVCPRAWTAAPFESTRKRCPGYSGCQPHPGIGRKHHICLKAEASSLVLKVSPRLGLQQPGMLVKAAEYALIQTDLMKGEDINLAA